VPLENKSIWRQATKKHIMDYGQGVSALVSAASRWRWHLMWTTLNSEYSVGILFSPQTAIVVVDVRFVWIKVRAPA
jgi:hypothetical protein